MGKIQMLFHQEGRPKVLEKQPRAFTIRKGQPFKPRRFVALNQTYRFEFSDIFNK